MADFGDNSLIFLIFSNFLKNMSMKCKADVLRGFILSCITRERLVPILNCFVLLSFIFIIYFFWGGGGGGWLPDALSRKTRTKGSFDN